MQRGRMPESIWRSSRYALATVCAAHENELERHRHVRSNKMNMCPECCAKETSVNPLL